MLKKDDRNAVKKRELRGRLDNYSSFKLQRIQEYTGMTDSDVVRYSLDCYYEQLVMMGEVPKRLDDRVENDGAVQLIKKIGTLTGNFTSSDND